MKAINVNKIERNNYCHETLEQGFALSTYFLQNNNIRKNKNMQIDLRL